MNDKINIYTIVNTNIDNCSLDIVRIDYEATGTYDTFTKFEIEFYKVIQRKRVTLETQVFGGFDDALDYYNKLLKDVIEEDMNNE